MLERLADLPALEQMVERTHRDVVRSGKYSYRSFVGNFDDWLDERAVSRRGWVIQSRVAGALYEGLPVEPGGCRIGEAVMLPMPIEGFNPLTGPERETMPPLSAADMMLVPSVALIEILARRIAQRLLDRLPPSGRPLLMRLLRWAKRMVQRQLRSQPPGGGG